MLDLKLAFRSLAKSPGFTLVAVATLALGIGANAAVFTLVHTALLQPLPYEEADRIVVVWTETPTSPSPTVPGPDLWDYQQWSTRFDGFAGVVADEANLVEGGEPERVQVARATHGLFPLLGIEPLLGRLFSDSDDVPGAAPVAVLSHGFWRGRYGGDPAVLGRSVLLDGVSHTVVGVLPESFRLLSPPGTFLVDSHRVQVFTSDRQAYRELPRNARPVYALGKLRADASLASAQADMDRIADRLQENHLSHRRADLRIRIVPLAADLRQPVRATLLAVFVAVGLVLLVACTNVANLSLVRALGRSRDLAVRAALGAGKWVLLRQLFAESLVLSLAGGLVGVGVAQMTLTLFLTLWPEHVALIESARIDGAVLAFTALVSIVTGAVFGVLPGIAAMRGDPHRALREGGRAGRSWRRSRGQQALVLAEVALSLALLIGAGLLYRTLDSMQDVWPGFEPRGVKNASAVAASSVRGPTADGSTSAPGAPCPVATAATPSPMTRTRPDVSTTVSAAFARADVRNPRMATRVSTATTATESTAVGPVTKTAK